MVTVLPKFALYPVAFNSHQNLVAAVTAEKKQEFFCIECNQKMILRQGKMRVEHFAHQSSTAVCNAESALHKAGKAYIKQIIQDGIKEGKKIALKAHCKECRRLNEIDNFPIGWDSVEEEYSFRMADRLIRPDIVVFKNNNPSLLIEVVVSHLPEDEAIESLKKYLKEHGSTELSLLVVEIKNWHNPLFNGELCIEGYIELSSNDCPYCKKETEQKEKERQAWQENQRIIKILEEKTAREKRAIEEYELRRARKYLMWRDLYRLALTKTFQREIGVVEVITRDCNCKIVSKVEIKNNILNVTVYDLKDLSFGELEGWLYAGISLDHDDPRREVIEWHNNVFDVQEFASRKELVLNHAYSSSPGDPLEKICRKLLLKESSIYSANIK